MVLDLALLAATLAASPGIYAIGYLIGRGRCSLWPGFLLMAVIIAVGMFSPLRLILDLGNYISGSMLLPLQQVSLIGLVYWACFLVFLLGVAQFKSQSAPKRLDKAAQAAWEDAFARQSALESIVV